MGYKVNKIRVGTQQVRPSVPATAITLNKSSISLTTAGQTSQLTATLTPSGSTSTVSWSSSNTSIATVSSSGLVTCVTPGNCTITATTNNGLTANCNILVWSPTSNTVAYYKFDGNMNDSSGNNRNLSVAQGTFTYGTLSQGAKYIQTNFNSYSSQISSFPLNSNSATISFWMSFVNGTAGNGNTSSTYGATVFDLVGSDIFRPVLSWGYDYGNLTYGFSYLNVTEHYVPSVSESWHLYTAVLNGGTASIYIDGVLRKTGTYTVQNGYSFRLNTVDGNSTQRRDYSSRDKLSELIFENKQWTAQEVQNYYNKTKSNYGL